MMWLLGALGIGGIGAALFLVPGLAANVLKALGAALGVVRDYPWQCAVLALCVALGGGWLIMSGKLETAIDQRDFARNLAKEERANHLQTIANYREAQVRAHAFALAAKKATEARYAAHAQEIDRDHETQLADARSDVDRYVDRVRAEQRTRTAQGGGGSTVAASGDRGPGVLQGMPADHVAVAESDLRACAAATAYALDARTWALGLAR